MCKYTKYIYELLAYQKLAKGSTGMTAQKALKDSSSGTDCSNSTWTAGLPNTLWQ